MSRGDNINKAVFNQLADAIEARDREIAALRKESDLRQSLLDMFSEKLTIARAEVDRLLALPSPDRAEIEDLKSWVITFLAPHAVKWAREHGLDGLYPTHYDMLEKCGARMVDFKRAALTGNGDGL